MQALHHQGTAEAKKWDAEGEPGFDASSLPSTCHMAARPPPFRWRAILEAIPPPRSARLPEEPYRLCLAFVGLLGGANLDNLNGHTAGSGNLDSNTTQSSRSHTYLSLCFDIV